MSRFAGASAERGEVGKMNDMKKKVFYFISILILFFIIYEVYWSINEGGNVIVFIQNEQSQSEFDIDIVMKVNHKIFIDTALFANDISPYGSFVFSGIGQKEIEISSEKLNFVTQKKMFFFSVNWVVIKIKDDEIEIERSFFPILIQ